MTMAEVAKRIAALEAEVQRLKAGMQTAKMSDPAWVLAHTGRFKDDPGFDEIVRLGREYRESLQPGKKKVATKRPVKNGRA